MKNLGLALICYFLIAIGMAQTTNAEQISSIGTKTNEQLMLSNYKGICGCSNPMNEDDLRKLISEIKTKNSDVRMLSYSKQQIKDKCLLASQIKEITLLFTYDDTRNNFAKFAHSFIYDQDNYKAELLPFLVTPVSTKFGQTYSKCVVNRPWENTSYTTETARYYYNYGY